MTILLPTDFSEKSKNAAIHALRIFKNIPCTLYVMHAFPLTSISSEEQDELNHLPPEFYKQFETFLYSIIDKRENVNHKFKVVFKRNFFIEAIREVIHERAINLIVMGTNGVSRTTGSVMGKYTEEVMKKVKCPVLAISEKKQYQKPQRILFPTDYRIEYDAKTLATLLQIAQLTEAAIWVVELYNSDEAPSSAQQESKMALKKIFSSVKTTFFTCYTHHKDNTPCLIDTISNQTDMVAIVAKNLSIYQYFLNKDSAFKETYFSKQLPLLMLH